MRGKGLNISSGSKTDRKGSQHNEQKGKKTRSVRSKRHEGQLNTGTFDENLRLILQNIPEERKKGCAFFDSFFFISYMNALNKVSMKDPHAVENSKVMKWITKENIFDSRYVFVPMCQGSHWNLLVLCNLGEKLDSDIRTPCMLLLDSLNAVDPTRMEAMLKSFVFKMYKNENRDGDEVFDFPFKVPKVPQQKDGEKCGHYVLYFIYKFLISCPQHFNIHEDYPSFMDSNWFTVEDLDTFFEKMSSSSSKDECADTNKASPSSRQGTDRKDKNEEINLEEEVVEILDMLSSKKEKEIGNPVLPQEEKNDLDNNEEGKGGLQKATVTLTPRKSSRLQSLRESELKKIDGEQEKSEKHENGEEPEIDLESNKAETEDEEGERVTEEERMPKRRSYKVRAVKSKANKKRKAPVEVEKNKVKKMKKNKEDERKAVEEEQNEEEEEAEDEMKLEKLLIRAYPSTFFKAVQRMSDVQRNWVKEAGFGPLLSFSFGEKLPHSTLINCLLGFNHKKCELALSGRRKLKIKEEDVHEILGFPKGDLEISFENPKEKINHWGSQFVDKKPSRITEKNLREKMAESKEADENFKENFMVLMTNLFIKTDKTAFLCPRILRFTGDLENAKDYNWCKLVIEGLLKADELWRIDPYTQYYTGSYLFLLYFYLARTSHPDIKVKSTMPAFIGWNSISVEDRNNRELVENSFGKGQIVEKFEVHKAQKEHGVTDEQDDEDMLSKLEHEFDEMDRMRKLFGESLGNAMKNFPNNEKVQEYKHKFAKSMEESYRDVVVQKMGESDKSALPIQASNLKKRKLTKDEEEVWKWIYANQEQGMGEVFLWNNSACSKDQILSLQLGKEINSSVVDVYTTILNEDEKLRLPNSTSRFFFNTMVTMDNVLKGKEVGFNNIDSELIYMKFRSNVEGLLFKHRVDIINVDLIFFPIYQANHFYIICFNLKNAVVEIIDNRVGEDTDSEYNGIPRYLQEKLCVYISEISQIKSRVLLYAPVVRLQMKWRTKQKNVDSGIFAMKHMETYMGNGLQNWDCQFATEESNLQKRRIERARQIYAAKIIYSPTNWLQEKMDTEIKSMNHH